MNEFPRFPGEWRGEKWPRMVGKREMIEARKWK